ncbi:MAG: diguanylate cyclase [Lachnospiraceae bacterium]|nr:diguanylate cyclase [Lachnospiraceae bacterium]
MTDNAEKTRKLKILSSFIVVAFVLAALIAGCVIKDEWIAPPLSYAEDLIDGWTIIEEDGSETKISEPFSIGYSRPVTFYHSLPDNIDSNQLLKIKIPYYSLDAYVDEEKIYHAGPGKLGHITTSIGNVFALIPLKSEYEGKNISITVYPRNYHYDVIIRDAAIITMAEYSLERLYEFVPYGILCVVITIITIVSLILYLVFRLSDDVEEHRLTSGFFHLALFGLCAVGWIVADFHIIGMMTGWMILSGMINYVSFMLVPYVFSGILIQVFDEKNFFKVIHFLSKANFIIQMALFFIGVFDIPDGLVYSQILIVLIAVGMAYFGIRVLGSMATKSTWLLAVPTACFVFFAIIGMFTYIFNGNWMIFVALALTFYTFTVISYLCISLWNMLKKNVEMEQIERMAFFDGLTNLENRRAYDDHIESLNEKIENGGADKKLSVIMLDVNGLKKTNDIFGHAAGDELITGSAECIRRVFGGNGRCFRTGGDEFVVIASLGHDLFKRKSEDLEEMLLSWSGKYISGISISIGKADRVEFPDMDIHGLLEEADKRMYENKQNYYASLLDEEDIDEGPKNSRRKSYADNFTLTKYTMPIVRQMAEVIPGGFFIYREDKVRELIYHNNKVLDIYGCNTSEEFKALTGNTFQGMVYPEDFDVIQESIDKQIDSEDGDGMDHVIYRITRLDGKVRWVDDYGHFSHSPDYGDIYYVFISDITDSIEKM